MNAIKVLGVAAVAVATASAAGSALAGSPHAVPPSPAAPGRARQAPGGAAHSPGRELFLNYCASCHGVTGQGDGPIAPQLRHTPTDVTRYALQNGGAMPTARLHRLIDGRDIGSHGTPEMPVWGDAFKTTEGGLTPEQVRERIAALVVYLESIQKRNAQ